MLPLTSRQTERLDEEWAASDPALQPYIASAEWDSQTWMNAMCSQPFSGKPFIGETRPVDTSIGQSYPVGKFFRRFFYNRKSGEVVGFAFFLPSTQGPLNAAHEGWVFTAMDEAFGGRTTMTKGKSLTANLSVKFKKVCPLLKTLKLCSVLQEENGRKCFYRGTLEDMDGSIIAEGTSLFIRTDAFVLTPDSTMDQEDFLQQWAQKMLPLSAPDGSHYTQVPGSKLARQEWLRTLHRASPEVTAMFDNPHWVQSCRGRTDGVIEHSRPLERRGVPLGGQAGGKMHFALSCNTHTRATLAFVRFLLVAEGPPGCAQGGAIGTAILETLFTWCAYDLEEVQSADDMHAEATEQASTVVSLTVNYKKPIPLQETVKITTTLESAVLTCDGTKADCTLAFQITSLDGEFLYDNGTALMISSKSAALARATKPIRKGRL